MTSHSNICIRLAVTCAVSVLIWSQLLADISLAEAPPAKVSGYERQEALRLGEQMYRKGILPSGEPMQAVVKGDITVEGTAFTCASCHLRGGLGSVEGGVITPPTNGKSLFQPLKRLYKGFELRSSTPLRPAYTDGSLAELLRAGVHPSGRRLDEVMPRYLLDDRDMGILIYYLKSLSTGPSPGFSDNTLRFATVITDDVSPEDRDAMLGLLDDYITSKNNLARMYEQNPRQAMMAQTMLKNAAGSAYLRLSLSQWLLKGPESTWRSQLEEYNRMEPVFALIGGISNRNWRPVHEFCEANQIPCILPVTDFPVISETDWYTLYISKGYYQEGEGTARYINSLDEQIKGRKVVQVVRDSNEGRALSAGFEKTWQDLGNPAPVNVSFKDGENISAESLKKVLDNEKPACLLLWSGTDGLPALETLASLDNRPDMVFVSSGYIGNSLWSLKDDVRGFTYISYPFRLPQDEARLKFYIPTARTATLQGHEREVVDRTYAITAVLTPALMDMRENYYRDNFLDVIGMFQDFYAPKGGGGGMKSPGPVPLYERLSFGPGQRYASKGCYIVQLTKGPKPELVKKSEWVIH